MFTDRTIYYFKMTSLPKWSINFKGEFQWGVNQVSLWITTIGFKIILKEQKAKNGVKMSKDTLKGGLFLPDSKIART